jgi:hypothetical protein
MAQEWCLAYGILEWNKAKKVYEAICKKKGKAIVKYEQKSPVKASKISAPVVKKEAKKRKLVSDDLDDTGWNPHIQIISFILLYIYNASPIGFEGSGVWEGQGAAGV